MHTTFGLPGGNWIEEARDIQYQQCRSTNYQITLAFPLVLSLPGNFLHIIFNLHWLKLVQFYLKWSNKLGSKFGVMDKFTVAW